MPAPDSDDQALLDLLALTAQSDQAAFKRLYDLTAARLLGVARAVLKDASLAEDAVQDAFVQVWHRAGDYHAERGRVLSWMSAIVRYRAIDLTRRQGLTSGGGIGDEPEDVQTRPDTLVDGLEREHRLRRCLETLSGQQRRSISLAFFEGLSHHQLADRLSTPVGTVKSRIRRGLRLLQECLRP